ncbi:hypothetical protein PIB30_003041 [Stylosanthes scabra]|uniref:Uncharacterized protein n=1 Tax=Stylosanthes scabra TaxID=79078 RepID=A0ABU6X2V9_9FABA|nr:hypothetical protein [Stylosanthes scabra]
MGSEIPRSGPRHYLGGFCPILVPTEKIPLLRILIRGVLRRDPGDVGNFDPLALGVGPEVATVSKLPSPSSLDTPPATATAWRRRLDGGFI